MMETPSEPLASVMHEYSSLENFWKRYNRVLLDKLALDREKQSLSQVRPSVAHGMKLIAPAKRCSYVFCVSVFFCDSYCVTAIR